MNATFFRDIFSPQEMDEPRKAIKSLREDMISKAKNVAHSLNFKIVPGGINRGTGDCLWEVFQDQLYQRNELYDILKGRNVSIQDLRNEVVDGLSNCEMAKMVHGNGKNNDDWLEYLQPLRQPQYYAGEVGDIALPGLAHQFGVNILLLYTSQHLGTQPYTIIPADCYGGQAIIQFPIIMAYNGEHMESIIPQTNDDLNQTVRIINQGQDFGKIDRSSQGPENDVDDNFTLPTPPYVPLVLNKENYHDNNEEEKFEEMKEEANRIRQKNKKDRTDEEKKKFKSLSEKIARYKKKIRDSGKKGPVLEQNEENKFKNMEKEANEILLKKTIKEQMRKRKN